MEEKKETISQKTFEVSPEGEIKITSREVTPESQEEKRTKSLGRRKRHAEGVFRNPPNVPSPMDLELDRIREEKIHKARGKFLEEIEKRGLRRKTTTK